MKIEPVVQIKEYIKSNAMSYFIHLSKVNNKLANDIKELFINEVPKELTMLNDAIEKQDYKSIRNTSLKLKSSVSFVGLDNVKSLLNTIEEKSASGEDIEHINEMFKNVKMVCSEAIQELENA